MTARQVPAPGDLVWVDLDPVAGTEQAGRRPVLVVSETPFNEITGRMVVLPVSSRVRGWPSEVPLSPGDAASGVVLTDQVRTLDWHERPIKLSGQVGPATLYQARQKLALILGIPA